MSRKAWQKMNEIKDEILKFIKKIVKYIITKLPLQNIILLESYPDYTDNALAVFNELIKRKINKKYKIIWITDKDIPLPQDLAFKNVSSLYKEEKDKYFYYTNRAKCILCGNIFIDKRRNRQYFMFLAHGAAFKYCKGKYSLPENCVNDDALTFSEFMAKYDASNLSANEKNFLPLGYPRNDTLLNSDIDAKKLFENYNFEKIIYWLPTYRQNRWGANHSSISIPVIHDENAASVINECAKKNNVLIVVKPHPAQVMSFVLKMNLSNLVFIDNDFLTEKGVNNYELLGASDALITDYSSVYFDYLIADKPIGLCWEDFEEYKKNEGFTIDPEIIMKGGEKIYNPEELCSFIERISNGEDFLNGERRKICKLVHKYPDGGATKRVVDHILNRLGE